MLSSAQNLTSPGASESRRNSQKQSPPNSVTAEPSKHVAPKYTIDGILISSTKQLNGRRLSPTAVKVPATWAKKGGAALKIKTKKELESHRRKEKIPHMSYDLDGDGSVS